MQALFMALDDTCSGMLYDGECHTVSVADRYCSIYPAASAWYIDQIHHMAFYLSCSLLLQLRFYKWPWSCQIERNELKYNSTKAKVARLRLIIYLRSYCYPWTQASLYLYLCNRNDAMLTPIHILNILCSQHQTNIIHQRGPRRIINFQSPIPIPPRHLLCLPQKM